MGQGLPHQDVSFRSDPCAFSQSIIVWHYNILMLAIKSHFLRLVPVLNITPSKLTRQQTRTTRRLDFLLGKLGEVFSLDNNRNSNLSIP